MIQKVNIPVWPIQLQQIAIKMPILEKQIVAMREISDQLIIMNSDLVYDHNKESLEFEAEYQKMVTDTINISHSQDIDTLNRSTIMTAGGPGPVIMAPQLPVLALKPDPLSFSMFTADLCIWKEAYRSYHRASEFNRYSPKNRLSYFIALIIKWPSDYEEKQHKNNYPLKQQHGVMWINHQCGVLQETSSPSIKDRKFFNFQKSIMQDALEARERLLILMKETDADQMGQEDIASMIMKNCFLDPALKAKLVAVKMPTLASLNEIIESHEVSKRHLPPFCFASENAIKGKGKSRQQPNQAERD